MRYFEPDFFRTCFKKAYFCFAMILSAIFA
jgi:hypothetical protein